MLSRLSIAALWSPAGKGPDLLALVGDVYCILFLSHVVSWVRCGAWLYRFLIFALLFYFDAVGWSTVCDCGIS